jgi:hypothetical protein
LRLRGGELVERRRQRVADVRQEALLQVGDVEVYVLDVDPELPGLAAQVFVLRDRVLELRLDVLTRARREALALELLPQPRDQLLVTRGLAADQPALAVEVVALVTSS